jgi:UDP-2,3-diacylglucosamine pyrophosphatase LpxH
MNKNVEHIQLLKELVDHYTLNNRTDWEAVVQSLQDITKESWTKERARSLYRWTFNEKFQKQRHQAIARRDDRRRNRMTTNQRLLGLLNKKRSIPYLVYTLGVSEEQVLADIMRLQLNHYPTIKVWTERDDNTDTLYAQNMKTLTGSENGGEIDLSDLMVGDTLTIGIVSDTHMGSKHFAKGALEQFYDYAIDQGVTTFYHVGDLTDGWYTNRPTSIFDQYAVGFQQQLDDFVENYPYRDGVTTYCISGNHDATHMRNGGANIGEVISHYRDDIVYLGHNFAKVWLAANTTLGLIHPTDGSAQSLSLKLQQVIDRNEKRHADIMLVGHYHKTCQIYYKHTYGFLVPSFEYQTGFMEDNNLTSDVGGLILTIKVDKDGYPMSVKSELVMFDKEHE